MKNNYTDDEIEFLKNNYNKGTRYCSNILSKSIKSVRYKLKKIGLYNKEKKYDIETMINLIKNSDSIKEVVYKMGNSTSTNGNNYKTVYKYIKLYSLEDDLKLLREREKKNRGNYYKGYIKIEDILVENSTYSRTSLKKRLYKIGLLKEECSKCGNTGVWMNEKISLILDHINGIWNDNRIENLRILCPNCHATTDTYCRKKQYANVKVNNIYKKHADRKNIILEEKIKVERKNKKEKTTCECGNIIKTKANKCTKCSQFKNRKVERPSLEILLKEVGDIGYSATGRKYGVSDNAIRKWIKRYKEKEINIVG